MRKIEEKDVNKKTKQTLVDTKGGLRVKTTCLEWGLLCTSGSGFH